MRDLTFFDDRGHELAGSAWLSHRYGVSPVQPLRYTSHIGGSTVLKDANGFHRNTFISNYRPEPTLAGHLEFMLKYERIHLEFLSRLFEATGGSEVAERVRDRPTGQYSRRAAWLFEWLTGEELDVPDTKNGPYVNALDPEHYWTGKPVNEPRFRVRNNMPGTADFCPMVLMNDQITDALMRTDVKAAVAELGTRFDVDLIRKAAIWLTVKESRSSFSIEGENDPSREDRFAAAMELYLGQLDDPFGEDLELLQSEVLGEKTLHIGLRQSPIFVGQSINRREVVHYVAPCHRDVEGMMRGLAEASRRTVGSEPLVRAAALSFGFVYIHPLCDGNGRLSRFVINDVLRRDRLVEAPLVVPVSATIQKDMAGYDRALETFSRKLMLRYRGQWKFGNEVKYPDGEVSNFEFDAYYDGLHAWRYLDLTDHVVYLAGVIRETLSQEMVEEAEYLRVHYERRKLLGEVIQVSDNAYDRIIRSVVENKGVSGKLRAEYPLLDNEDLRQRVLEAVLPDGTE